MNYNKRLFFYDRYLKYCLGSLDHVIPYTNALLRKFRDIGLDQNKLTSIPWGVRQEKKTVTGSTKDRRQKKIYEIA